MLFEVSDIEKKKAKVPHDLFLVNLIGNHILMFVSTLGLATSWAWPLLLVPLISVSILAYTLWRGKKSLSIDPWYVSCHWQICVHRSKTFIKMLTILVFVLPLAWYAYTYLGWMKEAVYAFVFGLALFPIMVTILVLIIMESEGLHSANQGKLPNWVVEKYPNSNAVVVTES